MFLSFFGLREQPFGVTPDPRFLYLSAAHREALASLYYGIEANRGFLGLIARPGMGKTTILFHLLEKFRDTARTALIFQTQCNSREFMRLLLAELGYEGTIQDLVQMHEEFNKRLMQEARAGHRLIVVIDEAQNLELEVLETLRLLSNFETSRAKLMHIILAGQPALADKLVLPGLAQLRQRVSMVHGLEPLPSWEVKNYIEHRLMVAGYRGDPLFTPQAYETIAEFTEGIPRNVNNFCFNALSLACALRKRAIDADVVNEVMADLDIEKLRSASEAPRADLPFIPVEDVPRIPSTPGDEEEISSPAQAAAYMQQVALKLKDWRQSLEKAPGVVAGSSQSGSRTDASDS
ncbi:MAG TPA: AAA family ATPase [Terriglobales bacterium]|jgi:general secretion pathway protein A|nr:AAA family ATPase [Terriglobales bacterium]